MGLAATTAGRRASACRPGTPDRRRRGILRPYAPILFTVLACYLAGFASLTAAQQIPDAGTLRQQIERDLPPAPPPANPPPLEAEPQQPAAVPEGAALTVKRFVFDGATLLTDEHLQALVKPWVDRPIGFNDLQQAVQTVASDYRANGRIVHAYLPRQDVTDGVVRIQIVESVFAGARVESPLPTRVDAEAVIARVQAQQAVDAPIQLSDLDRALLLADDLPGVAVSGALEPGQRAGQTALALKVQDEPLVTGEVGADNAGARATGAARLTGGLALNSPLKIGDRLRLDGMYSEGSNFGRIGYDLPIGAKGWRAGLNASWLDYRLVADEFAALNGRGQASSVGVDASYPLIRSRLRNLYFTAALDDRRYRNEALDATQSDYGVRTATLGLSGNLYDRWGGGGQNTANLAWVTGRVNQKSLDFGENPALGGRFNKLRYSVARVQTLTSSLSLSAALSGQHASHDLDSSERFYLGGPYGVRAYPVNEGSGSRGQLANLELRWRLPAGLSASVFYDWGHVSNFAVGRSVTLKGAGVSLGWSGPRGIQVKATIAVRDGHNPNPTASGSDQDGSLKRTRAWLQLAVPF